MKTRIEIIADELLKVIQYDGTCLTSLARNYKGEYQNVVDNITTTQDVELDFLKAIEQLFKSGYIILKPDVSLMVHMFDGAPIYRLPIAKHSKAYKTLHWLPTVVYKSKQLAK